MTTINLEGTLSACTLGAGAALETLRPAHAHVCMCAYMLTYSVCPRQSRPGASTDVQGVQNDSPALAATRFLEQATTGRPGGPVCGREEVVQVPARPATPRWGPAAGVGGGAPGSEPHGPAC